MRILFIYSILVLTFICSYTHISFAGCNTTGPDQYVCGPEPPNPDTIGIQQSANDNNLMISVLDGAGINVVPGSCIITGDGTNDIDISGAELECNTGVRAGSGDSTINVTDSIFNVRDDGVASTSGNNIINVLRSMISARLDDGLDVAGTVNITDSVIVAGGNGGGGDVLQISDSGFINTINIINSDILCRDDASVSCNAVDAGSGVHNISIVQSLLRAPTRAIELGGGSDTLTLGTGSNIEGVIDCEGDSDTLIFAMQVPTNQLEEITTAIESSNPAGDNITINGLSYTWEDCEELDVQLQPGLISPVPTLSQWSLIATAGLLGIIGFLVIRRRQLTA